jgi:hypothetical protein
LQAVGRDQFFPEETPFAVEGGHRVFVQVPAAEVEQAILHHWVGNSLCQTGPGGQRDQQQAEHRPDDCFHATPRRMPVACPGHYEVSLEYGYWILNGSIHKAVY